MSKQPENSIEKKLLAENDIDGLIESRIKRKIEEELVQSRAKSEPVIVTDFQNVPAEATFEINTTYRVLNRKTLTESYINGIQANALIGLNQEIRRNLEAKYADNFTVNEYFVKFNNWLS